MTTQFAVLAHVPLPADTHCQIPKPLGLDDPALCVMTDFNLVRPVTCEQDMLIDDGLEKMKTKGVRLLLVCDEKGGIIGLVTAKDIQGEKPVQLVRESGLLHSQLTIRMIMTPRCNIEALSMSTVRNALIGHVVTTLHEMDRRHTLVIDLDPVDNKQIICGMFSSSQIAKQLGIDVGEAMSAVSSLAEIHQELT